MFLRHSAVVAGGVAVNGWLNLAHAKETPAVPNANQANDALTLKESLQLAGSNLINILNPQDNYLPYWELTVTPDYHAALKRGWPAHNLGRWLDAMYRLEDAIGFDIPKPIDDAMSENVRRFFDNPDVICLEPDRRNASDSPSDPVPPWDLHSLREGLLALNALAKFRDSEWATDTGIRMIRSLDSKWREDGSWDLESFDACRQRGTQVIHNVDPSDTHGRLIEALIWFYESTGAVEAIAFATKLSQWHLENTTSADGSVINPRGKVDHTHSYFGTLRGLLLFGRLTRQSQYVERVAEAYEGIVRKVVKPSGYTSHNMVEESFGETTSPGDAAQLALWLAFAGHSDFLDDAERLVRSRILPSQILRCPALIPRPGVGGDATSNLEERIIGAYGGCHHHPHAGKQAVTDVTAADVHTLVDLYQHVTVKNAAGVQLLFHLDRETEDLSVRCTRRDVATLEIKPKRALALSVRVPEWAPADSIIIQCDGRLLPVTTAGNFVFTPSLPAGSTFSMRYGLPITTKEETGLGGRYQVQFKGDDVITVEPNSDFFPFYPSARAKE